MLKIMRKTKQLKFRNAEEKKRYLENEKSWKELKAKYEPTKKLQRVASNSWSWGLVVPPGRECSSIPSLSTTGGNTAPVKTNVYSGTLIKGIGMMHKSNFVPVIDDQQAKDIASMRR